MFPNLLNPLLSRLSIWWLEDMFLAHRMAAIVNLNTLKQISQLSLPDENDRIRLALVKTSLEKEVLAVEGILGISPDD